MAFSPPDRVVLTAPAKVAIKQQYGATDASLNCIGVVVENPYAELIPPALMAQAHAELGMGEVFVRWSIDPDTPTPMANDELVTWMPSGIRHPQGRFAIGDTVMTTAAYCPCDRCDFTAGRVIAFNPPGVTRGNTVGHPYMVQWDDGWITHDNEAELCLVGNRYNIEEDYV